MPKRMPRNGTASMISTAPPTRRLAHGWPDTLVAKRPQKLVAGSPEAPLRFGSPSASMRRPAKPSSAGSSVVAASTMTATPTAAARPRVLTNGIGTTNRPRRAMHTVMPAKIAARPEVCSA